jgi:hypothetical protein
MVKNHGGKGRIATKRMVTLLEDAGMIVQVVDSLTNGTVYIRFKKDPYVDLEDSRILRGLRSLKCLLRPMTDTLAVTMDDGVSGIRGIIFLGKES